MNKNYKGRVFVFDDFRLDAYNGRLEKNGCAIPISPTLHEILLTLIEDAGDIVSKQDFMSRVWPGRVVEEGNLARNISSLRKLLGDDPQRPHLIDTAQGRGYRFVAAVQAQDAGPPRQDLPSLAPPAARALWRSRAPLIAGAAVLLVAIIGGEALTTSEQADRAPGIRSIVVLPIANMSGDPDQAHIADGLTEELISSLGRIPELSVTSRSSAMQYQGSEKKLPDIARDLGVEGAIEGSVLRAGDGIQLTLRVVDAAADRSIWSNTYDRDLGSVMSMHNEITVAVAGALGIELTPELASRLDVEPPIDESAHEAYLLGLFFRNQNTVDSLHHAIAYFESAIDKQPDFARAYAAMADAYLRLASWQGPARHLWPRARAAANTAIELDADVAEAHLVRAGALLCHDLDAAAAEPIYLRAIDLNPGNRLTLLRYSYSLMTQGRFDESIEWAGRGLRLDPVSLESNTQLGLMLHFAGRHHDALAQLEHTLLLDSDYAYAHYARGLALLETGHSDSAIAALEKSQELGGAKGIRGELGYAYAVGGRIEDAERQLRLLSADASEGRDASFGLALVHYGLGNEDEALKWLYRAYGERDFRMIRLAVDPIWDELRASPGFADILVHIGLQDLQPG